MSDDQDTRNLPRVPTTQSTSTFPLLENATGQESLLFDRLGRLSDGVFAITLTLLVLSFEAPAPDADLGSGLAELTPTVIAFGVTVFVVAIIWSAHHHLFDSFQAIDGTIVSLNFLYLALVAVLPFPSELIGTFVTEPLAWVLFATVIAAITLVDTVMFIYAQRAGLLKTKVSSRMYRLDLLDGVLTASVFIISIPLAFVLIEFTPLLWLVLIPLEVIISQLKSTEP